MDLSIDMPTLSDLSASRIIAIIVIVTITVTATRFANSFLDIIIKLLSKIKITVKTTAKLNKHSLEFATDLLALAAYIFFIYDEVSDNTVMTKGDLVWLVFLCFGTLFMSIKSIFSFITLKVMNYAKSL